jgi:hypothetical protein
MLMRRRMSAADRAAADKASEWIAQVRAEKFCVRVSAFVLPCRVARGDDGGLGEAPALWLLSARALAFARALSAVPGMSS